ncbi:MEDS domain-containing protein [Paenisporosarcina sp. OV554]|uniref:MEDS domain-containing protein n=1 Tax=Paenisporosarcina sp. OV554 TaxID=2135694 RepID=UPI000D36F569|nr:MEDS domain-containing protein [Paenisporosarcina sp. OV554]PUB18221.1 DcmR-like sensory protein [Paenisporosarcina sp. OV554]
MKSKMNQLFETQKKVHVLYSFNEMENYMKQVLSYIIDGVAAGDYVILIENDRVYPIIYKELSNRLAEDQMKFVHFVNSFDFYFSSGSYHPPAIADYFNKMVQPYSENKISFRSWAHVEWATMEEPLHLIEDFEKIVDEAVNQQSFPLICAYEGKRMPDYLKTILMETHPYVLMEDELIVSEQYQPSNILK